jgi:hypothetical protein
VLPGHGKDGRANVLSTQGLNPYASLPDVADTAGALVGVGKQGAGETLAGQLNPFITGLIESDHGAVAPLGREAPASRRRHRRQTAANVVEGLPHVKLLETLVNGEAQPKPNKRTGKVTNFLYRKDARAQIAALLGVPVKELDTRAPPTWHARRAVRRRAAIVAAHSDKGGRSWQVASG